MTDNNLDVYAHNLAEMSLENGFDENAYILKTLSELSLNMKKEKDIIPDSDIDDRINALMQDFIFYYNSHSVESLERVMKTIKRIVSEIYHGCESREEQEVVRREIVEIKNI